MTERSQAIEAPDLLALVREASDEALARLIGDLEAAKAAAWAKLTLTRTEPKPEDRLLSMPDAAKILAIPEDRAYDLARQGRLPVVTIGKYKRVREAALRDFIAASETPTTPGRRLRRAG